MRIVVCFCLFFLACFSNIFFTPSIIGTEFKSVACPITGAMLQLEIQEGKEAMKDKRFNKDLGTTAGCTVRLMEACSESTGIKGDAWFGSVTAVSELALRGFEGVMQVKQNHGLYPKKVIEDALKESPGGVHIILKGTLHENTIIAIGYRYNSKKTLFFAMTSNAGTTEPGRPYEMKYTDPFGNVKTRLVSRPAVLSDFFLDSNTIDCHNQSRQYDLALEKCWQTQDAYFRLVTTLIGITVTDCWKLADFHGFLHYGMKQQASIGIQFFAGILARQLIDFASSIPKQAMFAPSVSSDSQLFSPNTIQLADITNVSSLTDQENAVVVIPERTLIDVNGVKHHQVAFPLVKQTSGKKCTKTRACKVCKSDGKRHLVRYYCHTCGLSASYCVDSERDCFRKHVSIITRSKP